MSAATLEAKLAHLKRLLIEARDLAEISDYFGVHLVEYPEFMRLGRSGPNLKLEEVINASLQACFGASQLRGLNLLHVPEHGFWHGAAVWGTSGVILVLYFEGVDLGLLSLAKSLSDRAVHFIRFTVCAPGPPGDTFPVKGPRGVC